MLHFHPLLGQRHLGQHTLAVWNSGSDPCGDKEKHLIFYTTLCIQDSWDVVHYMGQNSLPFLIVSVRVSTAAQNIMTKKQVGEERVYSAYTFHIPVYHQRKSGLELKQDRKQELMQRPWRDVTYWLASPGLLSLFSYRTQDYQPRDGTTHKRPSPLGH